MDGAVGSGPLQIDPWENLLKEIFDAFEADIIEKVIHDYEYLCDDDQDEGIADDYGDDDDDDALTLQQRFFSTLNRNKDKVESAQRLKEVMNINQLHHDGLAMMYKVKQVLEQLRKLQQLQEVKASEIFVGREKDIQLIMALLGEQSSHRSELLASELELIRQSRGSIRGVYVSGIGGQGKTTLARKVCENLAQSPEPWQTHTVSLRNKSSPEEVLQAVLSQTGIFCSVPRMDQLLNSLLEFISSTTQKTLIYLDNCEAIDKNSMNWFLTDLFQKIDEITADCKVKFLLTSRSKFEDNEPVEARDSEGLKISGALFELKLDSLTDDEGVELLTLCSGMSIEDIDEERAHNIVTYCSLSPLAITMVSQSLKSGKFKPQQLLFHLKKDQRHATKEMQVDRCMEEVYETLDEKLKASLVQLSVYQSSKFNLRSAQKILKTDEVNKILQTLHDYHFLEVVRNFRKHNTTEVEYSLHPLVSRFIAEKVKAGQKLKARHITKVYNEAVVRFVEVMEGKVAMIYKMLSTKCKKGMAEMEENKVHIIQFYDFLLDQNIHPLLKKYPNIVKDKLVLVKKNISDMTDLVLSDVKKRRLFLSEAKRAAQSRCDAMYIFWMVENADVLSTLHQKPDLAVESLDELSQGRFAALRRLHDQPDYPPLVMGLFHKIKGQALWKLLQHDEAMKHLNLALHFYQMLRPAESYSILKAKLLKTRGVLLLDLKDLDKAEETLNEAYEIIKEHVSVKDPNDIRAKEMKKLSLQIPEFFRHFGAIQVERSRLENDTEKKNKALNKALEYLNEGMALDKQLHIDSLDDFAAKKKLCADIYMQQGLLDEAEKEAEAAERQRRSCLQLPHINVTESVYQMGKIYIMKGLDLIQKGNEKHGRHYFRCAEDWFSELESDHLVNGSIPTIRHPLYAAIKRDHLELYRILDKKRCKKLTQFYADIENGKYDGKIESFKTQFQSMKYTPQEILDKMYDGGGEEFGDNDTIICVEPDDGAAGNRHRIDSGTGGSSFDSAVSSVSEGGSLTEDLSRMNIQKSLSLEDEVFPQEPGGHRRVVKRQKVVYEDD